ncbi:NAD(P)-binding protein [Lentithecium fluviatile CBS 122367]|uniref:NAD(P)-binding protein n=1 Tax=Lentithecium fluviatile CBS 122367 TaxID=1168545 RepID=A0A6G1IVP4_9PLEO|nr:NAD(P)-binding protein [Lentithecium fluviatile CBS 122367]
MTTSISQAILIVGGGQGIGFETVKSILALSDTARIVVFDLRFDPLLPQLMRDHAKRLLIVQGDVRAPEDRKRAIALCETELGGVHTLVYTAGIITPIERIEKLDIEDVKNAFDVNVFGCMAMVQLCLPSLRHSHTATPTNAAYGKVVVLSSACDRDVTYHGWTPYCTTKAALTRFIATLAHEERLITVQGVYPKLTRTAMPEDVIKGKYKGVMAEHEIERFGRWDKEGDEMVEPPAWCGEAVARLAVGLEEGGRSGRTEYYDAHVPRRIAGT